jgi:hypothetical protein
MAQANTMAGELGRGDMGHIRFTLAGGWSVREFADLLDTVDFFYRRLNAYFFYTTGAGLEALREEVDGAAEVGVRPTNPDFLGSLVAAALAHLGILQVTRLEVGPPGVADFSGRLNPLKVGADIIGRWREVDTERMRIRTEDATERVRSETEAEARKLEIAADVIKGMMQSGEGAQVLEAGALSALVRYTLDEPITRLRLVADDDRVEDVSVSDGEVT